MNAALDNPSPRVPKAGDSGNLELWSDYKGPMRKKAKAKKAAAKRTR